MPEQPVFISFLPGNAITVVQNKTFTNIVVISIFSCYIGTDSWKKGQPPSCFGDHAKGVVIMSTYEEFMIIIAAAGLIVSILNMKNKK